MGQGRWTTRLLVRALDAAGWCIRLLPVRWSLGLGRLLGRLAALTQRRHIARIADHHTAMFGHPPAAPGRFHRRVYAHYGQLAIEFLLMPLLARHGVERYIDIEDTRRVLERFGSDSLIYTSGHWGQWEFASAVIGQTQPHPVHVVFRPPDDPTLAEWLLDLNRQVGVNPLTKWGAVRPLFRALRQGGTIAIATDQHAYSSSAQWVRFGQRPAATVPTIAALHLQAGAAIIVGTVVRSECRGKPWRVRVGGIVRARPGADRRDPEEVRRVLERIHQLLIEALRRNPEQYLWTHRRWRDAPAEAVARVEAQLARERRSP